MKIKRFGRAASLALSPAAVAAVTLTVFAAFGLYPFGSRTAAWCDMNQQVVPLLCQFKDILDGKSGMWLSFKSASGMNFWGVFFFFLASPFSLLVKFVDKSDMLVFANILILLKMMTCAFTAALYFVKSESFSNLGTAEITLLGFCYAVSGYTMLFYQNVIWLDVMYLFPLLLLSLGRLARGKIGAYIAAMTAVICVNYYLGYMVVICVILLAAVYLIFTDRCENKGAAARDFFVGSLCAALISAPVWLPCFLQYLTSGRKSSLWENLTTCDFITDYATIAPIFLCTALSLICVAADVVFVKERSANHKIALTMFVLLTVPLAVEPINKLWHTGSYMSFPARYAFMTVFFALILTAYRLQKRPERRYGGRAATVSSAVIGTAAVALFAVCQHNFIARNIDALSEYTRTLSGSANSFAKLCALSAAAVICLSVIYFTYRLGLMPRGLFLAFLCAACAVQSSGFVRIYMTSAGIKNAATNSLQRRVFDLADQIDDEDFYRVKTDGKIFDYNMIGAMGYNSIGHYTSLTDEDYMFCMKRLGYTSVWMEVGTCGGTELTDALLDVGYEISQTPSDDAFFSADGYYIAPTRFSLPLGIAVSGDCASITEIPESLTRAEVQQYLFEQIFSTDDTLVTNLEPDEGEYALSDGKYTVAEGERLIYRFDVSGDRSLYFDCFDELSNSLTEPIYGSFRVTVNGREVSASYPAAKENGLLSLGEFSDERVVVEVTALKDVSCASFGLFSLDLDLLGAECEAARTVGFSERTNGLSGDFSAESETSVALFVPYDGGFSVKVNGKSVPYSRTLSGFISFALPSGDSHVEISFRPRGLAAGAVLCAAGLAATVFAVRRRKRNLSARASRILSACVVAAATVVFALIYILPTAINLLFGK